MLVDAVERAGRIVSRHWRRAVARQRSENGHTFASGLSDGRAIDGSRGGNSAYLLNHECTPSCEAIETGDRVFIHALSAIRPGEELFIDCGLVIDGEMTEDIRAQYACHCGTSACRRSMPGGSPTTP
nr:SET domain-containing protein-lysine N-methyltransferase [Paraburkholderia sp. BL10I2N1]